METLSRRGFLGFVAAAPAIVRVSSLMKLPPRQYVWRTSPIICNEPMMGVDGYLHFTTRALIAGDVVFIAGHEYVITATQQGIQ